MNGERSDLSLAFMLLVSIGGVCDAMAAKLLSLSRASHPLLFSLADIFGRSLNLQASCWQSQISNN